MLAQVEQNPGRKPEHATVNTGYFSEAAVRDQKVKGSIFWSRRSVGIRNHCRFASGGKVKADQLPDCPQRPAFFQQVR
jgi:hypothetical protein